MADRISIPISLDKSGIQEQFRDIVSEIQSKDVTLKMKFDKRASGLYEAIDELKHLKELATDTSKWGKDDILSRMANSAKSFKQVMSGEAKDLEAAKGYAKDLTSLFAKLKDVSGVTADIDPSKLIKGKKFQEVVDQIAEIQKQFADIWNNDNYKTFNPEQFINADALQSQLEKVKTVAEKFYKDFKIAVGVDFTIEDLLKQFEASTGGGSGSLSGKTMDVEIRGVITDPDKFVADLETQLADKNVKVNVVNKEFDFEKLIQDAQAGIDKAGGIDVHISPAIENVELFKSKIRELVGNVEINILPTNTEIIGKDQANLESQYVNQAKEIAQILDDNFTITKNTVDELTVSISNMIQSLKSGNSVNIFSNIIDILSNDKHMQEDFLTETGLSKESSTVSGRAIRSFIKDKKIKILPEYRSEPNFQTDSKRVGFNIFQKEGTDLIRVLDDINQHFGQIFDTTQNNTDALQEFFKVALSDSTASTAGIKKWIEYFTGGENGELFTNILGKIYNAANVESKVDSSLIELWDDIAESHEHAAEAANKQESAEEQLKDNASNIKEELDTFNEYVGNIGTIAQVLQVLSQATDNETLSTNIERISSALDKLSKIDAGKLSLSSLSEAFNNIGGKSSDELDTFVDNIYVIRGALHELDQLGIPDLSNVTDLGKFNEILNGFPTSKQAEKFVESSTKISTGLQNLAQGLSKNISNESNTTLLSIDQLLSKSQQLSDLATIVKSSSKVVNEAKKELQKENDVTVNNAVKDLEDANKRYAEAAKKAFAETGNVNNVDNSFRDRIDEAREAVENLREESTLTANQIKQLDNALRKSDNASIDLKNTLDNSKEKLLSQIDSNLNNDKFLKDTVKLENSLQRFGQYADDAKDDINNLKESIEAMANASSDAEKIQALFNYNSAKSSATSKLDGLNRRMVFDSSFREQIEAADEYSKAIDVIDKKIEKWNVTGLSRINENALVEFKNQFASLKEPIDQTTDSYKKQTERLKELFDQMARYEKYHSGQSILGTMGSSQSEDDVMKLIKQEVANRNATILGEFKTSDIASADGIKMWTSQIREFDGSVKDVTLTWNQLDGIVSMSTKNIKTELIGIPGMLDTLKSKIKDVATYWAAQAFNPMKLVNAIKQGISIVQEYDDALVEMRKVSEETLDSLREFQKESFVTASSVGTTALAIQQSTADWLRLGEVMEDAKESARATSILLNVSEFDDISTATDALVAMSKAYKDIDKMDIINRLNVVGNNFAISTSGLAEALQDSASALLTAQNNIDESIALITAGNQVVQDPNQVGKAMRTIALRLTGTKVAVQELKDLGEETEGVVTTVAKLRDTIKSATAVESNSFKGFDILTESGNYKSTYEILLGIADIYNEIVELDQRTGNNNINLLLETMAGKNRANTLASILQSGDVLRDVYEMSSTKYQGSAQEELDKYLDSITAKIANFQNEVQLFWTNLISSDLVKGATELGTSLLKVINELGSLAPTLAAISAFAVTKKLSVLTTEFENGRKVLKVFGKDAKELTKIIPNLWNIIKSVFSGDFTFKKSTTINDLKNQYIALSKLMSENVGESANKLAEQIGGVDNRLLSYIQNTNAADRSLNGFIQSLGAVGVKARIAAVGMDLLAMAGSALFSIGISFVVSKFASWLDDYNHRIERLSESVKNLTNEYQTQLDTANRNKDSIDGLIDEYQKLSTNVDVLGRNQGLTTDEFNRYHELTNQIADMFPQLIKGYDSEGNAILGLKDDVEELTNAYKEQQQVARKTLIDNSDNIIKDVANKLGDATGGLFNYGIISPNAVFNQYDSLINAYYAGAEEFNNKLNEIISSYSDNDDFDFIEDLFRHYGFNFDNENPYEYLSDYLSNNKKTIASIKADITSQRANVDSALREYHQLAQALYDSNLYLEDEYKELSNNDFIRNIGSVILNSITDDMILSINQSGDGLEGFVTSLLDSLSTSLSSADYSSLLDQYSDLLNRSIFDENGGLISGFDIMSLKVQKSQLSKLLVEALMPDGADESTQSLIKAEVDSLLNSLGLNVVDELSDRYAEVRNEVFGLFVNQNRNLKAVDFRDLDLRTAGDYDNLLAYMKRAAEDSQDYTDAYNSYVALLAQQSQTIKDEIVTLKSLLGDSENTDKISAYTSDISTISNAIQNFADLGAQDKLNIYDKFASTFPNIVDGGELTIDMLKRLADAEYDQMNELLTGVEGGKVYLNLLRQLRDEAVLTSSTFESSMSKIAMAGSRNRRHGINQNGDVVEGAADISIDIDKYKQDEARLKNYTKSFTDYQKKLWLEVTNSAKSADEAIHLYENKLSSKKFDTMEQLLGNEDAKSAISIFENNIAVIEKGINDVNQLSSEDKRSLVDTFPWLAADGVSEDSLQEVRKQLYEIMDAIGVGIPGWEEYFQYIIDGANTASKTLSEKFSDVLKKISGNDAIDKELEKTSTIFSNAKKKLIVDNFIDGDTLSDAYANGLAKLSKRNISLPDLLDDSDFKEIISEYEELNEIITGGISPSEKQSLLEKYGIVDATKRDVQLLKSSVKTVITAYAEGAGEAGEAWLKGQEVIWEGTQDTIDKVKTYQVVTTSGLEQDFDTYVSNIKSQASTLIGILDDINDMNSDPSSTVTWDSILGDTDTMLELERILPGITQEFRNLANSKGDVSSVTSELNSKLLSLRTEYADVQQQIYDNNIVSDEARVAFDTISQSINVLTDYTYHLKNGLQGLGTSFENTYYDTYEGQVRSYATAISDTESKIKQLSSAYTTLLDPALRQDSVEFTSLVSELVQVFPELGNSTGSIYELRNAVAELMGIKSNEIITRLEELGRTSGITDEMRASIDALINSFYNLGNQSFSMDHTISVLKNARSELNDLAKFVNEVNATGLHLTADVSDEVYNLYPELLEKAQIYADGTVALDKDIYEAFIAAKEAEVQGDIEARIKELENANTVAEAEVELERAKIEVAEEALKSKSIASMQEALVKIENMQAVADADKEVAEGMAENNATLTEQQVENSNVSAEVQQEDAIAVATTDGEAAINRIQTNAQLAEAQINNSGEVARNEQQNLINTNETYNSGMTSMGNSNEQLHNVETQNADKASTSWQQSLINIINKYREVAVAGNKASRLDENIGSSDIFGSMVSGMRNLGTTLANGAKSAANWLTNGGLSKLMNNVMNATRNVANGIKDTAGLISTVATGGDIRTLESPIAKIVTKTFDSVSDKLTDFVTGGLQGKLQTVINQSNSRIDSLLADIQKNNYQIELLKANGGLNIKDLADRIARDNASSSSSGGGSSSPKDSSSGSGGSGTSGVGDEATEEANEFLEVIDWIEVRIKRIEEEISRLDKIAGNSFEAYTKRSAALKVEIADVLDEMGTVEQAYYRYAAEAAAVPLDESYKRLVRQGAIDIEAILDEDLKTQIETYTEWYNKATEMGDKLYDLAMQTSDAYKSILSLIQEQSGHVLSHFESEVTMLNNAITQTEEQGYLVSKKYYEALVANTEKQMVELNSERKQLIDNFQKAVDAGAIEEGSSEWHEMKSAIDDVTIALQEATGKVIEYNNAMRELDWSYFDLRQSMLGDIGSEAQFLIDLMSNKNMYSNQGYLTNSGIATKAMHGSLYNLNMAAADAYGKEVLKINEQLANDPNNQTLYNRRKELLELQQESILAAEQEKEAIRSLVKDGIEKAVSAMQELINAYEESLDRQKSIYDFQKNVESQNKNISNIQKQLISLSGDTSEENRKKLQELNNQLKEAQEDLDETLYERAVSDTKQLLTDLYDEYNAVLNARLDNLDVLIAENIAQINISTGQIADVVSAAVGDVGYEIQSGINNIFKEADEKYMPALAVYTSQYIKTLTDERAILTDELTGENSTIISAINNNESRISNYISNLSKSLGQDISITNQRIGDSILGIQGVKESVGNVNSSVGGVNESIGGVKESVGNVNSSVGTFSKYIESMNFNDKATTINRLISDVDKDISGMIGASDKESAKNINDIKEKLSQSIIEASKDSVKKNGQGIYDAINSINENTRKIVAAINAIKIEYPSASTVNSTTSTAPATTTANTKTATTTTSTTKTTTSTNTSANTAKATSNSTQGDGRVDIGDIVTYTGQAYFSSWSATPTTSQASGVKNAVQIYQTNFAGGANKPYRIKLVNGGDLGWVSIDQISGYYLGTQSVGKDQIARIDEYGGIESIVRPDGSILTPLAEKSMVIDSKSTENMWRMLQDPDKFVSGILNDANITNNSNNNGMIENNISITIPISHVDNADDFVRQLQSSDKFQRLFDTMLDSNVKGNSRFNKYNINFKK